MVVAESTAGKLVLKHQSMPKTYFGTCLGALLHRWLVLGGGAEIHEDYQTFLQVAIILLHDPVIGLPSRRWTPSRQ